MLRFALKVDIVIVHYKDVGSLALCLEALSKQTASPNRVFIVDNSADLPELTYPLLDITILRPQHNIGFAAACNLAVAQSRSDWVAFLNPDAFANEDWLEKLTACAGSNPQITSFSSKQTFYEAPDLLDGSGDNYHISGFYWRRGYMKAATRHYPSEVFSASGTAMLVKRKSFLELGGFDEQLFTYGEDVDLGFRLRLAGHACMYCEDATVQHKGYATSGGRYSEFALYHGHRNLVWVFFKNMPLPFLILFLPLHIAANMAAILKFGLKGQGKTVFRAKVDAILGLKTILSQRKKVQKQRHISLLSLWQIFTKSTRR